MRIQCSQCHNDPFDRWTTDDYYSFVSFFTGVRRKPGVEPREQRIYCDVSAAPAKNIVDDRPMPARVLGGVEPVKHDGDPRRALAAWLTSPENEMFSRNLANRIWAQLLGRGIIEPVDDVRVSNPPVNGPLLDALSRRLVESKFSLHRLVREICNSRVYQLSAAPNLSNRGDSRQFSHALLRRLRADVLLDSVVVVTGVPWKTWAFPVGTRAIDFYPRTSGGTEIPLFGEPYFEIFGRSGRGSVCACDTKKEPTLAQTLHMSVGDLLRSRLSAGGRIQRLLEAKTTPDDAIEQLFILALCRRPTAEEKSAIGELIGASADQQVYEDVLWGLLNSTEFAFNH